MRKGLIRDEIDYSRSPNLRKSFEEMIRHESLIAHLIFFASVSKTCVNLGVSRTSPIRRVYYERKGDTDSPLSP